MPQPMNPQERAEIEDKLEKMKQHRAELQQMLDETEGWDDEHSEEEVGEFVHRHATR